MSRYIESFSRTPSIVRPTELQNQRSFIPRNSHYESPHHQNDTSDIPQSWDHRATRQNQNPLPTPAQSQQQTPPINVRPPRSLPDPFASSRQHLGTSSYYNHALHVVNVTGPLSDDSDSKAGPSSDKKLETATSPRPSRKNLPLPIKKKSLVGGFVKRIRTIPKAMFRFSSNSNLGRSGSVRTDDNATNLTGMTSANTLPVYASNPPTPIDVAIKPPQQIGSGRSGLHADYTPIHVPVGMSQSYNVNSPPPDVIRLSDTRWSQQIFEGMHAPHPLPGSGMVEKMEEGNDINWSYGVFPNHRHNPDDAYPYHELGHSAGNRTTVMLYDIKEQEQEQEQDLQFFQPNTEDTMVHQSPPFVATRQPSSSGLSYLDPVVVPPVRTSFHSARGIPPPPPLQVTTNSSNIEVPIPVKPTPHAPQAPSSHQISTPPSLIPGTSASHNSQQPHLSKIDDFSQLHPTPQVPSAPAPVPSTEEQILSPISAHLEPTNDYRKMPSLRSSPSTRSHGRHRHARTITSYSDEPYLSQPQGDDDLNTVERFFKTLYHMPWVSHDRVTVDYLPREGLGKSKTRKPKTKMLITWYRSMISNSKSGRSSGTIDLLSNETSTDRHGEDSTTTSVRLRASVAKALGSPRKGSGGKSTSSRKRGWYDNSLNPPHQSRPNQKHRQKNGHGKRHHHSSDAARVTPFTSAMYPIQYPAYNYPYPSFSAIGTMPPVNQAHGLQFPEPLREQQQAMVFAPVSYAPYPTAIGFPPSQLRYMQVSPESNSKTSAPAPRNDLRSSEHNQNGDKENLTSNKEEEVQARPADASNSISQNAYRQSIPGEYV